MSDVKTRISRTKEYLAIMLDEIVEGVRADERERCVKAMKAEMESEHESVDFEQGYSSAHREAYMYCCERMVEAIKAPSNTPEDSDA